MRCGIDCPLALREHKSQGVVVHNLSQLEVQSVDEATIVLVGSFAVGADVLGTSNGVSHNRADEHERGQQPVAPGVHALSHTGGRLGALFSAQNDCVCERIILFRAANYWVNLMTLLYVKDFLMVGFHPIT